MLFRLKLNGMLELLVCTYDVKSVVENRNTFKKSIKEVDVEEHAEKTLYYVCLSSPDCRTHSQHEGN
jgi:uncharacterized protein YfcZ (UPF0381/DUF406 family)